jgi:YD repeat-containing protein
LTQINYGTGQVQTRQYNERLQMTRMTVSGLMDLEYKYAASGNNGQATAMKNHLSGEEVAYTYDSLKRLTKAETTVSSPVQWGQSYGYDGFGNLLSKTVTAGSAPAMSVAVDGNTNRVVGYTYDGNGNATVIPGSFTMGYNVDNRLVTNALSGGGSETYGYGADGKRVWRITAGGQTRVYFYGVNGERQGIYTWNVGKRLVNGSSFGCQAASY